MIKEASSADTLLQISQHPYRLQQTHIYLRYTPLLRPNYDFHMKGFSTHRTS